MIIERSWIGQILKKTESINFAGMEIPPVKLQTTHIEGIKKIGTFTSQTNGIGNKMAKCYQLIGVPGAGKSTWIKSQYWADDCVIVSTDDFVEEYAKSQGKTYSDVFADYMPTAVKLMADKVVRAREAGKDIIWDQTSVNVKSRKKKFEMLPNYYHIAVVFDTPEHNELMRRLANRPGKTIPENVINSMIASFQMPSEQEGFKEVWRT